MLTTPDLPQLELLHCGKVRDSFRVDTVRRLIVVTDRISAFDLKLRTPIACKGEVLNRLAAFWFERIDAEPSLEIGHHMLQVVDPQAMLVREAIPIRVEMVVRGAISGSMWRGYASGKRTFSGVTVRAGLSENELLSEAIVTPTTKEASDREITPEEIFAARLVTRQHYEVMHHVSTAMFRLGQRHAETKGLILADTKYEFGFVGDELVVIDEVHTPDSSRFWDAESYARGPAGVTSFDKEYVRQWMLAHRLEASLPLELPDAVAAETASRYSTLFTRLTGLQVAEKASSATESMQRLTANLVKHLVLPQRKEGY
jgi:phosphoribosylaminoimidazole-succinocarboxamide synthase